jgi:tetratricopeptide (TPR) repeat protein
VNCVEQRQSILAAALRHLHARAFGAAARLAEGLVGRDGGDVEAALVAGLAAAGCGQAARAAALLQFVAARRPDAAHPAADLVGLLDAAKLHAEIGSYFAASVALAPDDARLLTQAGTWRQQIGEAAEAEALLRRALSLRGEYASARIALAAAQADQGAFAAAIAGLQRVIGAGGGGAAAQANLAVMLGVLGEFEAADAAFRAARRLDPRHRQIAYNHGMMLLKAGRLEEGWPAFNIRLLLPGHSVLPIRSMLPHLGAAQRLDGQTVLLTHDSGFGDTLQFVRYAPMLAARGARVLLWVPRALHRLLAPVAGIAEVFSDQRAWPAHDFHCPVMRLPEIFGTGMDSIPADVPYLRVPAGVAARGPAGDGRRRVGVVWAGSAREGNPHLQAVDRRRSIDPAALAPLFGLPGIQWISLQLGRPAPDARVLDAMREVEDFADTAAIVATLDAVVSVDTAVAHLAAGMGKPVYLLDRFDNCWRWLHGRTDSPWYPTLRIFRQSQWGEWTAPVAALAGTLSQAAFDPHQ